MSEHDHPSGMGRRGFLTTFAGGIFGALATNALSPSEALAAGPPAKAKACIVLWMNGGPSHIDTFDPKPGTAVGGSFKAIKTRTKGLQICEHLPHLAEQSHRFAVIRGMSSREGNHDRAKYLLHTGYAPNPTVQHPSLGAWASEELGQASDLPSFVSLGGPSMGAGFLGAQHGPFVMRNVDKPPENVALANRVDQDRFERRRAMLEQIEGGFAHETGDNKVAGRRAVYAQAMRMMSAKGLEAFDVSSETAAIRKAYGETEFGRGCLTARRLVEQGVKVVEVTLDGWDTHKDNFGRTKALMQTLDPAMSALIKDLADRKMLDSTLVVWMGDFGRTPKISADEGRDHHPGAWNAVLAGGGIKGGVVRGGTDATGDKPVSASGSIANLMTTVVRQLGMDATKSFNTPSGRPITITDQGIAMADLVK